MFPHDSQTSLHFLHTSRAAPQKSHGSFSRFPSFGWPLLKVEREVQRRG